MKFQSDHNDLWLYPQIVAVHCLPVGLIKAATGFS